MANILKYNQFTRLNEAYEEDPEFRIKKYFDELKEKLYEWFNAGSLSNNTELYDIKYNTTNNLDKYLTVDFKDDKYYYQIIFIISLQEVDVDNLNECYIKVKRYDEDSMKLLKQKNKSIMISNLDEDAILEIISNLDDENSDLDQENKINSEEDNIF